jgi:hypothetical protein
MSDKLAQTPVGHPVDAGSDGGSPVIGVSPAVPTGLTASAACGSPTVPPAIVLVWTNHGTLSEATRNLLQRANDPSFTTGLATLTLVASATGCTDFAVVPNTTYHYRVRAENVATRSAWSNLAPGCVPLLAPTRLTALAPISGPPALSWTNRSFASGVELQRATNPTFTSGLATFPLPVCGACTDTSVGAETTYYYRVRTGYLGAGSPWSNLASVTTRPLKEWV